ncbi:MAG: hypothetical protein PF485_06160 [Bacteroidales bacterium]|jgi:exonuclease VII large subunit|nr:hypothetical protein [Bacteroidales bacterium]
MNDEMLKEVLPEILAENKEIRNEQQFLKTAFEKFVSQEQEALEHLKNFKVDIDLNGLARVFDKKMEDHYEYIKNSINELSDERNAIIKTISQWKEALISFLKLSIIGTIIILIVLLFGKYYLPVINENLKYKNAFEYIYYTNEESQDFLQELILEFDYKDGKKNIRNKTKKLREESTNPLVFSK